MEQGVQALAREGGAVSAAYLKQPETMRPVSIRPAHCSGKIGFQSPALAVAITKRHSERARVHYRCSACGLWHIGTDGGGAPPAKARADLVRRELPQ